MKIETKYNIGQEVCVMRSNYTSGQCEECGQYTDSISLPDTKEVARIETIEIREQGSVMYGVRFKEYKGCMHMYSESKIVEI